jgi:hypothetical protein
VKNHSTREQHLDTSWQKNEHQYPDPPDNPEFDLFDEAFQERIAQRFGIGILRSEQGNKVAALLLEGTIRNNISAQRAAEREAAAVHARAVLHVEAARATTVDLPITNAAKRRTRRAGGVR